MIDIQKIEAVKTMLVGLSVFRGDGKKSLHGRPSWESERTKEFATWCRDVKGMLFQGNCKHTFLSHGRQLEVECLLFCTVLLLTTGGKTLVFMSVVCSFQM